MNLVSLVGRLTKNPDLKYTASGKAVATFTLAVQKEYKRDEADFIKCIIWGKGAETINEHLIKGKRLAVQGRISVRKYNQEKDTKWITEVIIDKFDFIDNKENYSDGASYSNEAPDDDDFPF